MGALQIIFFPGGFPEWQRLWNEEDLVKSVTLHNCVSLGKSFDLYEIRFLYLKDKFLISIYLSTYMKHLMQCASCMGIWINEDWATVDSPVLRSTVLHLLKTVHCAFSYESEVLDWVTLLEAFQWCGPPHMTKTELSGHMGWVSVPVPWWVIFLVDDQPFGYTELNWYEATGFTTSQLREKQTLCSLCGKRNIYEARFWDPNLVLRVSLPLAINGN